MTVDALIGEMCICPLVDTSTGVLLVHATTVECLQLGGVWCMVQWKVGTCILGIGGNKITMLSVTRLLVTLGSVTKTLEFRIVPVCPVAILLGMGALQEFSVNIQFNEQVLALPGSEEVLFDVTNGAAAWYGVFLVDEITLDAHMVTRCHVWVAEGLTVWESDDVDVLIEQTLLVGALKTAWVACALASAWHDLEGQWWTTVELLCRL